MKSVLLALSALLIAVPEGYAQSWRIYSPRRDNFSVRLPAPLRRVTFFEGKHGASNGRGARGQKGIRFYATQQTSPRVREYGIVVIEDSEERRSILGDDRIGGLEFLIGGDDAEPTSESDVRVNGLAGKEFVYGKAIAEGTYTRGRIFDIGHRTYVLVFRAKAAEDLVSSDATRFFDSFRLVKQRHRG